LLTAGLAVSAAATEPAAVVTKLADDVIAVLKQDDLSTAAKRERLEGLVLASVDAIAITKARMMMPLPAMNVRISFDVSGTVEAVAPTITASRKNGSAG
jgi:hypothetical protein